MFPACLATGRSWLAAASLSACAHHGEPAAMPVPAACEDVDPSVAGWTGKPDAVSVVLEVNAPPTLPDGVVVEAEAGSLVQVRAAGTSICALGALPEVLRVRRPFVASPK
jgi:hypothetical protein